MTTAENNTRKFSISALVILFAACFVLVSMDLWKAWHSDETNMQHENVNYYSYLPAFFLNHGSFEFDNDASGYMQTLPDGRKISTKTYGVAFMQAPFFVIAVVESFFSSKPRDGFGLPFINNIHWCGIIYGLLGLILLRKFLLRYFSDTVTAITLLTVYFGTNLFYYSTGQSEMDHVYLFFLLCVFLHTNTRWHESPSYGNSIVNGMVLGLITLIRETELVLLILFLFWGVSGKASLLSQAHKFRHYWKQGLLVLFSITAIWIIQMLIWKSYTGSFYFRPGENERYFWSDPQMINFLFSYRKGWLLYSPLVILVFAGFFFMKDQWKAQRWMMLLCLLLLIYVLSCWWDWSYGGGFGARCLSHEMAWLSIPLAAFVRFVLEQAEAGIVRKVISLLSLLIICCGISLNLGQTYQYVKGYIHFDSNSEKAYKHAFGKYSLAGKEKEDIWGMLNYMDMQKMKSGEQRNQ